MMDNMYNLQLMTKIEGSFYIFEKVSQKKT